MRGNIARTRYTLETTIKPAGRKSVRTSGMCSTVYFAISKQYHVSPVQRTVASRAPPHLARSQLALDLPDKVSLGWCDLGPSRWARCLQLPCVPTHHHNTANNIHADSSIYSAWQSLTSDGPCSVGGASGQSWSPLGTNWKRKAGVWVCTHSILPFLDPLFLPLLPSVQGLQRPDVGRSGPVPGDDDPFGCSHPTHDVIHFCDDRDFGETHHCIQEVFGFFQRLHSYTQHKSFNSSRGSTFTKGPVRNPRLDLALCLGFGNHKIAKHPPPSPTSWLAFAWRGRQTPRSSTSSTSVQCLQQVRQVIKPPPYRVCGSEYVRHTQNVTIMFRAIPLKTKQKNKSPETASTSKHLKRWHPSSTITHCKNS